MKIAIVNRRTGQVEGTYRGIIDYSQFGGAWGDPSMTEHVKIPCDLESESIGNLEPFNGEEQDGTQMVQLGEEPAFDAQRKPIRGANGQQIMTPVYEEQPVMKPVRLMRRKS